MEELLNKLLNEEILDEDTRKQLVQAFNTRISEAVEKAESEARSTVTVELNEKWVRERDMLIEALDAKVSEVLKEEIDELKTDIERFRDLEAEYAEKLVESKSELADELKSELTELIEKLDKFLEIRLSSELEELREDVVQVKKDAFGRKIFEAFVSEFTKRHVNEDTVYARLSETQQRLEDALSGLEAAEEKIAKMERKEKLTQVLSPLSGRAREVMEAILKSVDTSMLEEAYKMYVGRVLKETKEDTTSEKEDTVLAEDKKEKNQISGVTKTGDNVERLIEQQKLFELDKKLSQQSPALPEDTKRSLQKIAGIYKY